MTTLKDQIKKGAKIKNYTLISRIGMGGNGVVWNVKANHGGNFALKILKSANKYNLDRFRNEIAVLSALNGKLGIMPLLDQDLDSDIKWYLMPVSIPSKIILSEKNYTERIRFYSEISKVLTELHDQQIFHRDIKPENLFMHNSVPTIGDFGLVKFPDSNHLTEKGKKLGPSFYIAPEMLDSPDKADSSKADVYSLAKSLWVALTDQNFPIPGQHSLSYNPILVSTFINDERLVLIDRVLELSTTLNPNDRLTMKEFSEELENWLNPEKVGINEKLNSEMLKKLGTYASIEKNEHDEWDRFHTEGNKAFHKCYEQLTPFFSELKSQFNGLGTIGGFNDIVAAIRVLRPSEYDSMIKTISGGGFSFSIEKPSKIKFWCGLGMEIFKNGEVNFGAAYLINTTGFPELIWQHSEIVKIGTPSLETLIAKLSNEIVSNFKNSMDIIGEKMNQKD